MFLHVILLLVGMLLLVKGADWFVDGASDLARACKVPSLVIGLTLVSMGTSAPELSVSIQSALGGMNDMSIGNVVGSNAFNTLLILGLSALLLPVLIGKDVKRFDIPIMLGFYLLLLLFSFVITPYALDRFEGIVMICAFLSYTLFLIFRARKAKKELEQIADLPEEPRSKKPLWLSILLAAIGLAGIIFGGDLVVDHAAEIAKALGMSEAMVGLTILAVGTSLPELVTSVVAALKHENDIAVGNVVGSNSFNVVLILGVTAAISPLAINPAVLIDLLVMLASGVLVLVFSLLSPKISRWQGALMVACYVAYLVYIIIRH